MVHKAALVLIFLLLPLAAAFENPFDPKALQMSLTIEPPEAAAGQDVNLRIVITDKNGELLKDFNARLEITHEGQIIYQLEGEFPTSELLIPYRFAENGDYQLRLFQNEQVISTVPFRIGPEKQLPPLLRFVLFAALILIFLKIRPRRKK